MRGLCFILKSTWRDKFCLMTFFLPVVAALALRFAGNIDLSSLGELHFGILEEELPQEAVLWLEQYGSVTVCETKEEWAALINEPSTSIIGVRAAGQGIRTAISGDELEVFKEAANTLPALYAGRSGGKDTEVHIADRPDVLAGFGDMFFVMILITAMFMGCTFNAMNMISEKEEGVAFVNDILPMSRGWYVAQKTAVGFLGGCLSALFTAGICFSLSWRDAGFLLLLIVLSAFVSALVGLFVGKFSDGLLTGVTCIKVVMLVFIAVPVLCYLAHIDQAYLSAACYLVPTQAAFEGIMGLLQGDGGTVLKDMVILGLHGGGWLALYLKTVKG